MKSITSASLTALPAELTLLIFSHLPLSTLGALQRVDHYFSTLIAENESTVYRNVAWVEGWVPSPQTQLGELRIAENHGAEEDGDEQRRTREALYSRRAMRGVQGWKDFCRKRKTISEAWSARAPSSILSSPRSKTAPLLNVRNRSLYHRVHRIKVDENAGLIMTTSAVGGLVVRDLESDQVLWELPVWYVPAYAHLEYDRGYMIFHRDDGSTEVWRRTEDSSSPSSLITSHPDEPQLKMAERLSDTVRTPFAHAHFTPYALFLMPEPTRASRFVFPTFLASSLDRTFLWDVPTGERVQTLEGIQTVLPLTDVETLEEEAEDQGGDEDIEMDVDENGGNDDGDEDDEDDGGDEATAMLLVHANPTDISNGEAAMAEDQPFQHLHTIPELSPIGSPGTASDMDHSPFADGGEEELDDDENDEDMLPRFLGLIRYVEVSERHVVIVGRYLLRVFSRATGKAILDIPSTRPRYGSVRWEVASAAWARGMGVEDAGSAGEKGKGKETNRGDSYQEARKEGREAVRMPLKFTYEEWSRSSKLVIDQFIAAHLSSDGQHLVTLLSGLRLLIIPYFETLSTTPANTLTGSASTSNAPPTPAEASSSSTTQGANGQRRAIESLHTLPAAQRRRQHEREVYYRILDVQLGAPRAAGSVYLAYENGRIGVVTTNAVYIITPNILPSNAIAIPNLTVSRVPFFSNPSWLSAVSCLMMSDTGMYLNWNPVSDEANLHSAARRLAHDGTEIGHDSEGESEGEHDGKGEDGEDVPDPWERDYQLELEAYESGEAERFHTLPSGDMFVAREPRAEAVTQSHVSTVYTINFAPHDSEEIHSESPRPVADSASKEA